MMDDRVTAEIPFIVADVTEPIISIMRLGEAGFITHFEKNKSYIEKDGKSIIIHAVSKGFYLKVLRKANEKICPVEADMPRGLAEPRTPTEEEKQAHRLTGHMPFAA